jgi:hypothetical protein
MSELVEQVASELEGRAGMDPDWEGLPDLARSLITLIGNAKLEEAVEAVENNARSFICPRLPHTIGMNGCDYCSGTDDGFDLSNLAIRKLREEGKE